MVICLVAGMALTESPMGAGFVVGRWGGNEDGVRIEETWTADDGSGMAGLFPYVEGRPAGVHEFMTIVLEGGSVGQRGSSISAPGLVGWKGQADDARGN
jgi:hypothetical protein